MSKVTEVPGMVSVYGATAVAAAWLRGADRASGAAASAAAATPTTAAPAVVAKSRGVCRIESSDSS